MSVDATSSSFVRPTDIYVAHANISLRNCNYNKLGYNINKLDMLQLQFLSLLVGCYESFDDTIVGLSGKLVTIKNTIFNMAPIPQFFTNLNIEANMNYINVPTERQALYAKIYARFAAIGLEEIKQCQSSCKAYSQSSLMLFNMLQSASIIYDSTDENRIKEANLIYNYVEANLNK